MLSERVEAWLRRHVLLVDGALAVGLGVPVSLVYLSGSTLAGVLSGALLFPLAVRRRWPAVSAAIVLSAAFVQWLSLRGSSPELMVGDVGVLIAIYSVTAYGPRWARWAGLAAGLLGAVLGGVLWPGPIAPADPAGPSPVSVEPSPTLDHVIVMGMLAGSVISVWAVARLRGVRRDQLESLRERARLLEVERDQRARLAVSTERARIAREMHDVVAHSLAVMIAQADGGRYAATDSPRAQAVLGTIGETGRQALGEMRRLLAVLREEVPEGAGPQTLLGPQPGLDDVPALVERVRSGGLPVSLRLPPGYPVTSAVEPVQNGVPNGVPNGDVNGGAQLVHPARVTLEPGVGLVVYRIVQEGLTNVMKHAGPAARADVDVHWEGLVLRVSVVDDGRGAGAAPVALPGSGQGLVGMRERAATYGGRVDAGPRPGGGYAVLARIPVVG